MDVLKFRPHHFLCALGFEGKGYSSSFVDNFQQIVDVLRSPHGDTQAIDVVGETDAICQACPEKTGSTCLSQEKIEGLDRRHGRCLGIAPGDSLTWGEAKEKILKTVSLSVFHEICKGCQWKDLGLCETALLKLHTI